MKRKIVIVLGLITLAFSVHCQVERNAGARSLGLNFTTTALPSDVWGLFSNPASIGNIEGIPVQSYFERRYELAELQHIAVASAYRFLPQHTLGLALASFGWQYYKTQRIAFAYNYYLLQKIHLAIQFNYLNTSILNYGNWSSFLIDVGGFAPLSPKINVAFKYQNLNQAHILQDKLPSALAVGFSYKPSTKLLFLTELEKTDIFPFQTRLGVEYHPVEYFFARAGAGIGSNRLPAPNNYFMTSSIGFGLIFKNFSLDLAAQWHDQLGITPGLSLGYFFNKENKSEQSTN